MNEAIRESNGRMLAPLPGAAPPITSENARAMVQRRIEKYRNKTLNRVVRVVGELDPTVKDGADAFAAIVANQAKLLHQAKDPKLADVEKLGKLMIVGPNDEARRDHGATLLAGADAIVATPAGMLELLHLIERDKRAAVEQASAIDGESND